MAAPAVRLRKKEGKRKENILGDLRGKPQQGPFSLNSLTNSQKKVALQPRANYASCAERCCELKARSAALCVASRPRTWSYSWRKKSRALRQPAQQQLAQTEFCPSLRAIKTSLFGKSGKRFQNLLNGCRREASFLTTCIINSATNCMILLKID